MLQKPFRKRAFLDPWFFCESTCFFDDFLIPPRSPKNGKTPAIWRILLKNHFSPNWKSSRCKNAPKCRRERRFLGWLSKNIERGGVGGTGSTPGSKLALATLLARHRRIIEWAIARVPPTPPFWLKGGSEREVITRFFCRCCRRTIQKNHGMTSTLLTGTLFGLLDSPRTFRINIFPSFMLHDKHPCFPSKSPAKCTVRTGQVWHQPCGRFRVKDGRVADRRFVYCCPFCGGNVASTVQTGQVNHRGICGNQFYVRDGRVSMETRPGRIHVTHATPSGKPCSTTRWEAERQA